MVHILVWNKVLKQGMKHGNATGQREIVKITEQGDENIRDQKYKSQNWLRW